MTLQPLRIRLWGVAAVLAALLAFQGHSDTISAHHNPEGRLPGVPNTPTIQRLLATGELRFCYDGRAASYPEFPAQTRQSLGVAGFMLGMTFTEIDGVYETPDAARQVGCQVYLEMPETHSCNGCAAHVFYANAVCHVQFKWQLGFVYWLSTIIHEVVHCLGAHEGYDDVNFLSHILTYGRWASPWNGPTVMDFGTHLLAAYSPRGVWEMTAADVRVVCVWLDPDRNQFTGCGFAPPPECVPTTGQPCWVGERQPFGRWVFADGWEFEPARDWWFNPTGVAEWMAHGCCGDRWNDAIRRWVGSYGMYDPATGITSRLP